jgi:small subunit ribosomal protein S20
MAHSKQALKRARQNERIRVKNKAMRADMKTQLKALDAAIASKDQKAIAERARITQSKLDKAAKNRVIHPNAASRLKARLARMTVSK